MQIKYLILCLIVILFCVVTFILLSDPSPPAPPDKSNSSYQATPIDCGTKFEGFGTIFGGVKAEQNSWPWVVPFLYVPKNKFFCGGSLISIRHVLSGEKIVSSR